MNKLIFWGFTPIDWLMLLTIISFNAAKIGRSFSKKPKTPSKLLFLTIEKDDGRCIPKIKDFSF